MKSSVRLLTVLAIATIGQLPNINPAAAESTQISRLVAQSQLAKSLTIEKTTQLAPVLPTAKELAQTQRKKRTPVRRRTPAKKVSTPAAQPSSNPAGTQSQTPATTTPAPSVQKQVLVSDILIRTPSGTLSPDLESRLRQVLTVKPGQPTNREQLEQNLNAIKALGAFSKVEIIPEDTPKGVRLSFVVTPYGTLRQVQIETLPANSTTALKQADIDAIFQPQYGRTLNATELQAGIKQLNEYYQKQGFSLAQVVDVRELDANGTLKLVIAEGAIEDVQVRYINKEGSAVDDKQKPLTGLTRPFIITREAQLKPGSVFNRNTAQRDLARIYGLGIFDDVRLSFAPGTDPAKVILQINVLEKKTSSIIAGGGLSSTNGLFGSVSYNQINVGGNAQKLGAEVQVGTRDLLFDLNYTDPWIATDPNRTSYTVNAFQRRSTSLVFDGGKTPQYIPGTTDIPRILRQGGGITFSRPLNGDPFSDVGWRASAGVQYQRVKVTDVGGTTITRDTAGRDLSFSRTGEDDLLMVQLGLTNDLRNSFIEPTQGSVFRLGVDQSIPIGLGNIKMTRARASYTNYTPVSLININPGPQALVFNIQGGTILGDLPPYEAFSLGGTSTVRGYEDGDVAAGRSYVLATVEYRFPIVSILGGEIFADYGSDLGTGSEVPGNPAGVRGKPGSGFGYGAGIRVNLPGFPVRIDYVQNSRSETRIQFGIGERF